MIGVFVTFRYGDNFDEQAVRKIAETARARFEGMPGLRSKAFTVNSGKREATNFYVWDSEDAAKAFLTDGNFSNKIDQVLMALSCYLNSAFSIRSTDGPDSFGWR